MIHNLSNTLELTKTFLYIYRIIGLVASVEAEILKVLFYVYIFSSFQMRKKCGRGQSARDWANISFGKQGKSNPAYGGSCGQSGILSPFSCHHWIQELMPALINIIHTINTYLCGLSMCIQRKYLLILWLLIKELLTSSRQGQPFTYICLYL